MKKLVLIVLGAALLCAAPLTLRWSESGGLTVSQTEANARVGRPLTATSIAGVHRRAHRRAYRGAYYGGYAYYPRAYYARPYYRRGYYRY
jgi:hypothetical protein